MDTTNSHAGSSPDQGRERLAVGCNDLATFSGVGLWCVEVEDEVLVVRKQGEAISSTEKSC